MSLKQYINEAHIPYWELLVYVSEHNGFKEISLFGVPNQMRRLMKYLKTIECEGFIRGGEENGLKQSTVGDLMSKWLYGARSNEIFKVLYRTYPGAKEWEWDWDYGLSREQINTMVNSANCVDYQIIDKNAKIDDIISIYERYLSTYE